MSSSNLPPGVSPNDPHLTGEWPCKNCGATLPEEVECPRCGGTGREAYTYDGEPPENAEPCTECGGRKVVPFEGEECPDGCPEPDYDDLAEQKAEARADYLAGRDEW